MMCCLLLLLGVEVFVVVVCIGLVKVVAEELLLLLFVFSCWLQLFECFIGKFLFEWWYYVFVMNGDGDWLFVFVVFVIDQLFDVIEMVVGYGGIMWLWFGVLLLFVLQ